MYSVGECRAFDRLYDRFAQARPGEQRPPPHPGTMGGVRSRLLPRLFEFPSRVAPADHGFLAEIRVVLRGRCTGQGCSEAGCDGGGVGKAATTRRSGTSHHFLLLMISLSGSFPNITNILPVFDVRCASLCPHTRHSNLLGSTSPETSEIRVRIEFVVIVLPFLFLFLLLLLPLLPIQIENKILCRFVTFFFFYFLPRIGLVSWYVLLVFIYLFLSIYIYIYSFRARECQRIEVYRIDEDFLCVCVCVYACAYMCVRAREKERERHVVPS